MTSESEIFSLKKILLEGWVRIRKPRTEIHISDLIHCRRRVAFERLDENPPVIDERKLKFFLGGETRHLQLQNLLGPDFDCEKEITYVCKTNGIKIVGHCDAIHRDTDDE
ncbi:MAG: hypothetical protein WAK17_16230 [Candidatus Nitrosopolaris sp.]|jgi:hypothetical protein